MVIVELSSDRIYLTNDGVVDLYLLAGMTMLNLFHFDLTFVIGNYCDQELFLYYHLFSIRS